MTPGTYCVPRNRQEWEAILRLADSLGLLWKPFEYLTLSDSTFNSYRAVAFVDNMRFVKPVPNTECKGESLYSPEFMNAMYLERDMREWKAKREAAAMNYSSGFMDIAERPKKFNVPRLTVEARLKNLEKAFDLHLQEHRNPKRTISVSDPEDTGEKRFGSTTITFPPEIKITGEYPTGKYMVAIDPKSSPTNIPFEIALAYLKAGRRIRRGTWSRSRFITNKDGKIAPYVAINIESVYGPWEINLLATDWMVLPE